MTTVFRSYWLPLTSPTVSGVSNTARAGGSWGTATRGAHQFGDGSGIVVWNAGEAQVFTVSTGNWSPVFTYPGAGPFSWGGISDRKTIFYDNTNKTYYIVNIDTGEIYQPVAIADAFDSAAYPSTSGTARYGLPAGAFMYFLTQFSDSVFVPYWDNVFGSTIFLRLKYNTPTQFPFGVWKCTTSFIASKSRGNGCNVGDNAGSAGAAPSVLPYRLFAYNFAPPVVTTGVYGQLSAMASNDVVTTYAGTLWDQGGGNLLSSMCPTGLYSPGLYNAYATPFENAVGSIAGAGAYTATSATGFARATYSGFNLSTVYHQPFSMSESRFYTPVTVAAPSPLSAGAVVFNLGGATMVLDSAARFYILVIAQFDNERRRCHNWSYAT